MDTLTFYFDRCFGKSLPEALRKAKPPFNIQYQHDPGTRFRFDPSMPDDEWLKIVGEQGWIALSHDCKWHRIDVEKAAIEQFGLGCFYLWGGEASIWQKLRYFVKHHQAIEALARSTPRPFIFDMDKNGRFEPILFQPPAAS